MQFLTYLVRGISLGSVYALIALGYTMVYGIAKMLNFAHGDVIMVGGYAVFVLDFGKGVLSGFLGLWIAQALGMDAAQVQIATAVAFLGCTWGHIFTPWLKFKGGKGIAVAIGCLFVTFGVVPSVLELTIFGVLVVLTKYVSLGSMAAAIACPFFALWVFWGNWPAVLFCTIGGLTVFWAHRGNLKRLLAGEERRIGDKKKN